MKQTLTFNVSTIASTSSKINIDAWDKSIDAFDNKEFYKSFEEFLNYVNPEFYKKYGNSQGTEFSIPHGSIVVNIKLEDNMLKISAPFLSLPEKNVIPLLRQVCTLNFTNLNLAQIVLTDGKLHFEYACPIELVNPWKLYSVFHEICITGDKYDDEYVTKFGAERIYEPKITPYDAATIDTVYGVIQQSCDECINNMKDFETDRKYGNAWNIIASTLYKISYYAHPQGQLLNDLDKAVREHDREDIPLPEIVTRGKDFVQKLKAIPKDKLAEDLYYVETFIPPKRRSSLENIQQNFKQSYENVSQAIAAQDYLYVCLVVPYKFYEMYYYNNLQDDINNVVVDAMQRSSAQPLDVAAPILHKAMEKIMDGDLTVTPDLAEYTAQITEQISEQLSEGVKKIMSFFNK
jgi:predicted transcriptional regulator